MLIFFFFFAHFAKLENFAVYYVAAFLPLPDIYTSDISDSVQFEVTSRIPFSLKCHLGSRSVRSAYPRWILIETDHIPSRIAKPPD